MLVSETLKQVKFLFYFQGPESKFSGEPVLHNIEMIWIS